MHIDSKEIEAYVERQARRFNKNYDELSVGEQFASRYGVAVTLAWDVIMDLDPDVRAKRIKQIRAKA